jgi:flagellar biosynthetic protein FliR
MATIIYLIADAHHQLLTGIADSFHLLPLPWASVGALLDSSIVTVLTESLFIILRIAGPIAIVLFITNVTLALLSRVAPQVNVFSVGLPLQLMVGLTMMIITMPLLATVLPEIFAETPQQLDTVLRHLQPLTAGASPPPRP